MATWKLDLAHLWTDQMSESDRAAAIERAAEALASTDGSSCFRHSRHEASFIHRRNAYRHAARVVLEAAMGVAPSVTAGGLALSAWLAQRPEVAGTVVMVVDGFQSAPFAKGPRFYGTVGEFLILHPEVPVIGLQAIAELCRGPAGAHTVVANQRDGACVWTVFKVPLAADQALEDERARAGGKAVTP